jgi:hypothetical protein
MICVEPGCAASRSPSLRMVLRAAAAAAAVGVSCQAGPRAPAAAGAASARSGRGPPHLSIASTPSQTKVCTCAGSRGSVRLVQDPERCAARAPPVPRPGMRTALDTSSWNACESICGGAAAAAGSIAAQLLGGLGDKGSSRQGGDADRRSGCGRRARPSEGWRWPRGAGCRAWRWRGRGARVVSPCAAAAASSLPQARRSSSGRAAAHRMGPPVRAQVQSPGVCVHRAPAASSHRERRARPPRRSFSAAPTPRPAVPRPQRQLADHGQRHHLGLNHQLPLPLWATSTWSRRARRARRRAPCPPPAPCTATWLPRMASRPATSRRSTS